MKKKTNMYVYERPKEKLQWQSAKMKQIIIEMDLRYLYAIQLPIINYLDAPPYSLNILSSFHFKFHF